MEDKKKRCQKTTRQQYILFLKELRANEPFRCNKLSPENPNIISDTWNKLTNSLNSVGGPQRSVAAWKKVFTDWKSSVRKRARTLKADLTQTGGGSQDKPLTDLENLLIEILGQVTIDDIDQVLELGIDNGKEEAIELKKVKANPKISEVELPLATSSAILTSPGTTHQKRSCEFQDNFTPRKINKPSILSSLRTLVQDNQTKLDNAEATILAEINSNLKALVDIEEKRYQLELLKLKLKYPNIGL